jgi:hypothetical protein
MVAVHPFAPVPVLERVPVKKLSVYVVAVVLLLALAAAGPAAAAQAPKRTSPSLRLATRTTMTTGKDGVRHYHFVYGPIHIAPGQNSIFFEPNNDLTRNTRPKIDGYITRFSPNLIFADTGKIPRVDVVHLHHAVWGVNGNPTWAAGEEKTVSTAPKGYGWPYKTTDKWYMNHMIHDLTPVPQSVFITYDIDFVPATSPLAKTITPVRTQWMDVEHNHPYPVFNALKGSGTGPKSRRRYTYPDDDPNAYPGGNRLNQWTVTKPETLVGTAGHLHPGGLYTDLTITRGGRTKLLFRSRAKYWEPAGAVSWDVSMTATPANWRVNVKPGDVVKVHGTYDTTKASWYESMAIMPVAVSEGWQGVDPFTTKVPTSGQITHGPLAENRVHGGQRSPAFANPLNALDGPVSDGKTVTIDDFFYSQGDMAAGLGLPGAPPTVHQGQTLTFKNDDAPPGLTGHLYASGAQLPIYHTITDCKAPCNRSTGIAYPLADGAITFDSGELGYGPVQATAAAQRQTWSVPKNLPTGTYTYFCRIHPFMRGSFRVVKS